MADNFLDEIILAFQILASGNPELFEIAALSIQVHLLAVFFATLIGLPLGYIIAYNQFKGRSLLVMFLNTAMGLPPVALGLILWILLNRQSLFGDLRLLFTSQAMILAQFILVLPIIVALTISALLSLDDRIILLLNTLDINGRARAFLILRESRIVLMTVIITGFGRAIAEVGAILIIGGNIRYNTRTLTTSIINEINAGSIAMALALAILLLLLAFMVNFALYVVQQRLQTQKTSHSQDTLVNNAGTPKHQIDNQILHSDKQQRNTENSRAIILSISNLKVYYNKTFEALSISYLEIISNQSRIVAVVGPNGSGKSTLLLAIKGLLKSSNQNLSITQQDESNNSYQELDRNEITLVPQNPILFQTSTIKNLRVAFYAKKMRNLTPEEQKQRINNIVNVFNLKSLSSSEASLSAGQIQRITSARALLQDQKIVLFDEPSSHLDPYFTTQIESLITQLAANSKLVLFSTQNLAQAKRIASDIIFLYNGQLIDYLPTDQFFSSSNSEIQAFIKGFLL